MTKPMPSCFSLARPAARALCVLAFGAHLQAQAQSAASFDIAAGEMKTALDAFARQSGMQLIYRSEDVKGLSSKGLKRGSSSSLPADEALALLLEGTALTVRRDVSGAVAIVVAAPAALGSPGAR